MTDKIQFEIDAKTLALGAVSGLVAAASSVAPFVLPLKFSTVFTQNPTLFNLLGLVGLVITVFQASRFTDDGVSIPKVSVYSAIAGFLIVGVAGYSSIPVSSALQSGGVQQELQGDNLRKATLAVDGMFCQGCKLTVKNYLDSVEGTKGVDVSLSKEQAVVIYDADKTSAEELASSRVFQGAYSATVQKDGKYSG